MVPIPLTRQRIPNHSINRVFIDRHRKRERVNEEGRKLDALIGNTSRLLLFVVQLLKGQPPTFHIDLVIIPENDLPLNYRTGRDLAHQQPNAKHDSSF